MRITIRFFLLNLILLSNRVRLSTYRSGYWLIRSFYNQIIIKMAKPGVRKMTHITYIFIVSIKGEFKKILHIYCTMYFGIICEIRYLIQL